MKVQVGVDIGSFAFVPGGPNSGTITFSSLPAITLAQILLVVDTVTGGYIYNPLDPATTGTLSGNVLTLKVDTSSLHGADPLQVWVNLSEAQQVAGTVAVSNLPSTQQVSGAVSISGTPSVDVANFPATQPVSGAVSISGTPSVDVANFPTTQPVSGSVSVSNLPTTQTVSATALPLPSGASTAAKQPALGTAGTPAADVLTVQGAASMTPLQVDGSSVTQPISGSVSVSNLPSTQPVSGTVSVSNLPATQPVEVQDGAGNAIGSETLAGAAWLDVNSQETVAPGTTAPIQIAITGGKTSDATPQYQPLPLTAGGQSVPVTVTGTPAVTIPVVDNTVLDSLTENSAGPGNTYTTTGFQRLSMQFGGLWAGEIVIESSNDALTWFRLIAYNVSDGSTTDVITSSGLFTVPVVGTYMRYNLLTLLESAPVIVVVGRTVPQEESPLIAQAMDASTGVQLNANIAGGLAKDVNSAAILSDAPQPIYLKGAVGTNIILDTQGYNSLHITTQAMACGVFASNDQITWVGLSGWNLNGSGVLYVSASATSSYCFPCIARYVKITVTAAGTATVYLRSQPWQGIYGVPAFNVAQVGGNTVASAGANGILAVSGPTAAGSATSAYPVTVAGGDPGGLVRRFLTDTTGRLVLAAPDAIATYRPLGMVPPAQTPQNVPALAVQEQATFESQSVVELLAQVLVELKMNNYYMFNLPGLLAAGSVPSVAEEPAALRTEPSPLN